MILYIKDQVYEQYQMMLRQNNHYICYYPQSLKK